MNKANREEIAKLAGQLADLKSQAETIGEQLRTLGEAEQEKYDNLSEGLQQGENGQKFETDAQTLSEAADYADAGDIGEAINSLDNLES